MKRPEAAPGRVVTRYVFSSMIPFFTPFFLIPDPQISVTINHACSPKIAMIPWETKMIRGKTNDPIVNYIYSAEKSRLTHSIATYRIYECK